MCGGGGAGLHKFTIHVGVSTYPSPVLPPPPPIPSPPPHLQCTWYCSPSPVVHLVLLPLTCSAPGTAAPHLQCTWYCCPSPAVHLVLLPLFRAAVVVEAPNPARHALIRLLDAATHLRVQLTLQRSRQ